MSQAQIRAAFQGTWEVRSIQEATFEDLAHGDGARAWLASIVRTEAP